MLDRWKVRAHSEHKRCDAKQPCTTCVNKNRGATCKYVRSASKNNLSPSKRPTSTPKGVFLARSNFNAFDSSHPLSLDFHERPPTQPEHFGREPPPPIHEKIVPVPSSDASDTVKTLSVMRCPPRPIKSSFSILPSINFQTPPRPLQIPLSLIPPERVQVSWVSGGDLDMTLYVFPRRCRKSYRPQGTEGAIFDSRLRALCRLSRLGLYFTVEKQEALLRGDVSNTVVDRHFVYAMQVFGVHVCGAPEITPVMIRLQASYLQMTLESLAQLSETNQTRTKVQALVSAIHATIMVGFLAPVQLFLLRACKLIEKAKLRFLPEYGPPAELSDQIREDVSVLSQVIYLENYHYLALGGPVPVRTAGIEREFSLHLQVRII